MNKILKWIKRNTGLFIVLMLTLILLVFIIVIFVKLLMGGNSNVYGNRLECTIGNEIKQEIYDEVKEEIMATEVVDDTNIRLQGKIVYTTIELSSDTSVDKAKEIAFLTLDNYSEEILKCYDFSFFLKWEGEEGDTVITGNRHHTLEEITWIKS